MRARGHFVACTNKRKSKPHAFTCINRKFVPHEQTTKGALMDKQFPKIARRSVVAVAAMAPSLLTSIASAQTPPTLPAPKEADFCSCKARKV